MVTTHVWLLYCCEESTKISSTTFSRVVAATPTFSWVDIFVMVGRCCHIFGNIFISCCEKEVLSNGFLPLSKRLISPIFLQLAYPAEMVWLQRR